MLCFAQHDIMIHFSTYGYPGPALYPVSGFFSRPDPGKVRSGSIRFRDFTKHDIMILQSVYRYTDYGSCIISGSLILFRPDPGQVRSGSIIKHDIMILHTLYIIYGAGFSIVTVSVLISHPDPDPITIRIHKICYILLSRM